MLGIELNHLLKHDRLCASEGTACFVVTCDVLASESCFHVLYILVSVLLGINSLRFHSYFRSAKEYAMAAVRKGSHHNYQLY